MIGPNERGDNSFPGKNTKKLTNHCASFFNVGGIRCNVYPMTFQCPWIFRYVADKWPLNLTRIVGHWIFIVYFPSSGAYLSYKVSDVVVAYFLCGPFGTMPSIERGTLCFSVECPDAPDPLELYCNRLYVRELL